VFKLQ